jgi:hypothetical protein
MRSIYEALMALVPGTIENQKLRLERERPTNHPGSKRRHEPAKAKARRKLAAQSNRINRQRVNRWSH